MNKVSNTMALSGRLICPVCGCSCWRKNERGKWIWRCVKRCNDAPSISETDAKHCIMEAFNKLPEEQENLLTLRDQIESALITPIDAQLAGMEEDDPDRAALLMQRTEYTQKRLQILSLLAWIDGMGTPQEHGDACVDYDEFVARTNKVGHVGLMTEFREEKVIRYMEKAIVHPDRLEVVFKAGVTMEVALSSSQSK